MAAYARYSEELVRAGIVLGEGRLQHSSTAVRLNFSGDRPTVMDGPFTESKELIAGYWLWQVRSMDEAVEWLKRAPFRAGVHHSPTHHPREANPPGREVALPGKQ